METGQGNWGKGDGHAATASGMAMASGMASDTLERSRTTGATTSATTGTTTGGTRRQPRLELATWPQLVATRRSLGLVGLAATTGATTATGGGWRNDPWYWWGGCSAPLLTTWVDFGWNCPCYWDYGPERVHHVLQQHGVRRQPAVRDRARVLRASSQPRSQRAGADAGPTRGDRMAAAGRVRGDAAGLSRRTK